ncbi:MAG TPA: iron-containing alcohol dehydrogenase, partial [Xanthobacteraceae bacterium]|nr:iron-containing alcohol dehydrogenase [Xanthobacteraceae bacterium]
MQLRGNWNYPTTVRFGAGRAREIGEAAKAAKITNPLFVTDPVVAKMPMTKAALDALSGAGVAAKVFADVQPNPVESNLAAGIAAFKAGGHDGVVAFGGGSALDAGKLIAFMKDQTRSVFDFEDVGDWWTRADASVIAPVVAVPTTAGTGSEVGRAAVVTNEKTHTKKIIFHPGMLPK